MYGLETMVLTKKKEFGAECGRIKDVFQLSFKLARMGKIRIELIRGAG